MTEENAVGPQMTGETETVEPIDHTVAELAEVRKMLKAANAESAGRRKEIEGLNARLAELSPKAERLEAYQKAVESLLAVKLEAFGDRAKKAVEALPEGMDLLDKLTWLAENEDLFAERTGPAGPPRHPRQEREQVPQGPATNFRL